MRTFRHLLATFLALLPAWALQGQEHGPQKPEIASSSHEGGASGLELIQDQSGELILAIHHPWKPYSNPSLEVCLLPEDEREAEKIRPMYFTSRFLKGRVTVGVYHCLDRADSVATRTPLTEGGISFEILGNRNSLGKPAVCVACRTELDRQRTLPRVTFCLPEHWALEEKTLYLDLPPDYFAAAGKLRVWLLRDNSIVWTETIRWPGIPGAEAAKGDSPAGRPAEAKSRPQAKPRPKKEAEAEE